MSEQNNSDDTISAATAKLGSLFFAASSMTMGAMVAYQLQQSLQDPSTTLYRVVPTVACTLVAAFASRLAVIYSRVGTELQLQEQRVTSSERHSEPS